MNGIVTGFSNYKSGFGDAPIVVKDKVAHDVVSYGFSGPLSSDPSGTFTAQVEYYTGGSRRMSVIQFRPRTYVAKSFDAAPFRMSGTLEGMIDFVVPSAGTYVLSLDAARAMIAALHGVISDVERNCLYDRDALLTDVGPE